MGEGHRWAAAVVVWGCPAAGCRAVGAGCGPGGQCPTRTRWLAAARDIPAGPAGVAVRAALTRLGRPYVWGAEGPSSFDCSGYTEWAWRQAGVQLGEDTYAQVKQGVPVPPGQVRAGDLIFPKDSFNAAGSRPCDAGDLADPGGARTAGRGRGAHRADAVGVRGAPPGAAGLIAAREIVHGAV